MTVSEGKTYIETILNKHSSGNSFSPQEYNNILEAEIFNFVKGQILAYRRFVNQGSPTDETIFSALLLEALQKQNTPVLSSGTFPLPADYFMCADMWGTYNANYKRIELVSPEQYAERVSNHLSKPIPYFPVAIVFGTNCKYFPTNMTDITLDYFAKPTIPVFDYYTDANYKIVPLAAGATHLLTAGEYGSAGQTFGTTVTSLTTELDIPEDVHVKFFDYIISKVAIRDRDANLYQANENEIAKS